MISPLAAWCARRPQALAWMAMLSVVVGGLAIDGSWTGTATGQTTSRIATNPSDLTSRELHVWGRFGPGTWKQVRITTETLNDRGEVTGVTTTETRTSLVGVDQRGVTLKIDVMVEVAGKRFGGEPQTVAHGYYGETTGQDSELKPLGSEWLRIDGRIVPCKIKQVVATAGQQQQVTRLFLSEDVEPYVLKRETTALAAPGQLATNLQTTAEVIALDRPYKVLTQHKSVAYERTIQKSPKGTHITYDVTSVDVPGGIVARTTKEFDAQGRLVRRSFMELVDYKVTADEAAPEIMTRRQARRARRGR